MGASCPGDFRPIAMIHIFAKPVSKILALRLAPRMDDLIGKNQNAFIRQRTIHDNYKYVQRAAVLIRNRKVPMLLLKIDISKAFDTLSWTFLLAVLQARGWANLAQMDHHTTMHSLLQNPSEWSSRSTNSAPKRSAPRRLTVSALVHHCHGHPP